LDEVFGTHKRYTHVSLELTQHAADRMEEALWG
jgi:hypothetical protein